MTEVSKPAEFMGAAFGGSVIAISLHPGCRASLWREAPRVDENAPVKLGGANSSGVPKKFQVMNESVRPRNEGRPY